MTTPQSSEAGGQEREARCAGRTVTTIALDGGAKSGWFYCALPAGHESDHDSGDHRWPLSELERTKAALDAANSRAEEAREAYRAEREDAQILRDRIRELEAAMIEARDSLGRGTLRDGYAYRVLDEALSQATKREGEE